MYCRYSASTRLAATTAVLRFQSRLPPSARCDHQCGLTYFTRFRGSKELPCLCGPVQ